MASRQLTNAQWGPDSPHLPTPPRAARRASPADARRCFEDIRWILWTCAVEVRSAHIPEEMASELGRIS